MVCYVSTENTHPDIVHNMGTLKSRQLGKSRESLVSTLAKEVRMETKDDYCGSGCCSCCCVILMFLCLSMGFLVGIVVGAVVEKNGYLTDMGLILIAKNYNTQDQPIYVDDVEDDSKCLVRMTSPDISTSNCAVCSNTRYLIY